MIYGCAGVSTDGQSVAARAAGAEKVFREVASEAKTDCRQLRRALDQLEAHPQPQQRRGHRNYTTASIR